ncbi:hypothetical protein DSO57_1007051 [Entomophthora muscae]|uniref:Uncharacterized protein n=1 Tax=Entomophthora muscae TaxID=34485 RepID=A0ACC2S9B0_9FUNG|nr:hypothetical protein DSO57_1007051 [Entomophthora muscae]
MAAVRPLVTGLNTYPLSPGLALPGGQLEGPFSPGLDGIQVEGLTGMGVAPCWGSPTPAHIAGEPLLGNCPSAQPKSGDPDGHVTSHGSNPACQAELQLTKGLNCLPGTLSEQWQLVIPPIPVMEITG